MKKGVLSLPVFLVLIFLSVTAGAQAPLYEQLPYSTAAGLVSSPDPYFGGAPRVYDDFKLSSTSDINRVTWWGFDAFPSGSSTFQFSFYADNGGAPGSLLKSYDSLGSPATENFPIDSVVINKYSINLDGAFNAQGGTSYWLSIFNASSGPLWGWQVSDYGNGSFQSPPDPFSGGGTSNVAFQLHAKALPIPPEVWLYGSGAITLLMIRRRMKMR